jgi:hypothetical protein
MLYEGGMHCYAEATDPADPNHGIRFDEIEIVGGMRCWESYARLLGKLGKGEERELEGGFAVLVRDTENKDDANAVAVYMLDADNDGHKVGYLAKDDAETYSVIIKQLERRGRSKVGCKARLYGKGLGLFARPIYHCYVCLPDPAVWLDWTFPTGSSPGPPPATDR